MFEVLTSEASYLRSLRVLTEHFMESRELEETMIIRDRKTLFSNILRIREVSERFLKDLEDRIFKDLVFADICDIIHYHAQHNFPAYIDYVRNQIYQEKIFSELMKNNTQFNAVITRLQESHHCQRLPFVSFLLLPFQRITRIKMLIEVSCSLHSLCISMHFIRYTCSIRAAPHQRLFTGCCAKLACQSFTPSLEQLYKCQSAQTGTGSWLEVSFSCHYTNYTLFFRAMCLTQVAGSPNTRSQKRKTQTQLKDSAVLTL
uniref:Rho guanine nucleotide exchange factor 15b n=1 Tax=Amphilophus citrinellus TaxID=61819 RepID=A0A3Q0SE38_AMPCI